MNIKYILLTALLLPIGVFVFFFHNSDETYLKKKTLKLIQLSSSSPTSHSETAILRRIQEIAKYIHFSVQYELHLDGHLHQDRSLAELRSLMFASFKKAGNKKWHIDTPLKEDITVTVSVSKEKKAKEKKAAEVTTIITANQESGKISCNTLIHWLKEKKWLIYKIKVFSCSSNRAFSMQRYKQGVSTP